MSKTESEKANSRRVRRTVVASAVIVAGWVVAMLSWPPSGSESAVARYIYGDRPRITGLAGRIQASVPADVSFTVGYCMVLGGLAWIFFLWAISAFGRQSAKYVAAAVGIALAAGLTKDVLINCAMCHHDSTEWITAAAAASIIKWCASLLALGGFLGTLGVFLRGLAARWRWVRPRLTALAAKPRHFRIYRITRIAVSRRLKALFPGLAAQLSRWQRARFATRTHAKWWNRVQVPPPALTGPADSEEWEWIDAYNVPDAQDVKDSREGERVQAICLSGGGVRSACIAMGVLQEFSKADPIKLSAKFKRERFHSGAADPKLIDSVDYMISVSGGGYTAGARLLAVQDPEKPLLSQRFEEGSPEFDHFRRNSSYIADSPGELLVALVVVLKNLIGSMAILFTLPAVLGSVFGFLLSRPIFSFAGIVPVPPTQKVAFMAKNPDYLLCLTSHSASWWAVAFFAVFAVLFTSAAMFVEFISWQEWSEKLKLRLQSFALGSAVFTLLLLAAVAGLPALMRLCWMLGEHTPGNQGGAAVAASGVLSLNYLAAIAAMAWDRRRAISDGAKDLSRWKRLVPPGVVTLILVMLTLAVLLVAWLITLGCFAVDVFENATTDGVEKPLREMPFSSLSLLVLLSLTLLWISSVDIASLSLNPFYRTRLGQTFAVRRVCHAGHWRAESYDPNEYTWFGDVGRVPAGGPKFVFAAAATISGRDKPAPGLNAVSYVMSRDYIGGPDLGWMKTQRLFQEAPPRIKRDLTVLTAVAVSGAAFASAMGRHQKGFEKLLAISGARLGTWLPNPKFVANLAGVEDDKCIDPEDNTRPWPKSLPYIRGAGYYYRELFGLNYSEGRLVQVTDGGHYENLGLVEALRRRSRLIFCVDGGGDTPPLASGLGDALRLAEYELGVTITFNDFTDYQIGGLTPGSAMPFIEDHAFYSLNKRLAEKTVAVGLISYPAASGLPDGQRHDGVLIFAKAVLTKEFPQWLLTYAAANDVFPHDPTSDQWFNEGQFAAYTELGRIMGREALACTAFLDEPVNQNHLRKLAQARAC